MIDILTNKNGVNETFKADSIMLTSISGQRLVITVNDDGEFNINFE